MERFVYLALKGMSICKNQIFSILFFVFQRCSELFRTRSLNPVFLPAFPLWSGRARPPLFVFGIGGILVDCNVFNEFTECLVYLRLYVIYEGYLN